MAIPTFTPPVPPSPGTLDKPEFKILAAEFGDGYSQETPDGLNNVRRVLSLTWETLLPAQANYIYNFITNGKGTRIFWYTPSNETEPVKWTCKDVSKKRGDAGLLTITATFKQSFNLVT